MRPLRISRSPRTTELSASIVISVPPFMSIDSIILESVSGDGCRVSGALYQVSDKSHSVIPQQSPDLIPDTRYLAPATHDPLPDTRFSIRCKALNKRSAAPEPAL